jgi:hypothetical protein
MDSTTKYRSATVYISHQTFRWLQWMAQAGATEESGIAVADAIADQILIKALLQMYPNIEAIEAEYQKGRKALNDRAKELLKSAHAELDKAAAK